MNCCSIFSDRVKIIVGAANAQGPPVPIPNTEVKLCGAENTRLEAVREDRARPTSNQVNRLGFFFSIAILRIICYNKSIITFEEENEK